MEQTKQESDKSTQQTVSPPKKEKLPASVHILCGWPLLLVAIGGAIGGGLGGAAYGINIAIYKSKMPILAKVVLNIVVGLAAVGLWLSIAKALLN